MQDYRKLLVWQKGHDLAIDVHKTLAKNRKVDAHLRSQMSRAARSVPVTIVEGCGRDSQAELAKYADYAIASSSEVEYWVLLAHDVGYFGDDDYDRLTTKAVELRKMLFGFRNAVRRRKRGTDDN